MRPIEDSSAAPEDMMLTEEGVNIAVIRAIDRVEVVREFVIESEI